MGKEEAGGLEQKVFAYWVNKVLKEHGLDPSTDLAVDFAVGSFFLKFIELVSGKTVPKDTNKLKVLTAVAGMNKAGKKDAVHSISPNHDSIALGIYFLVFLEHMPLKRSQVNEIADAQVASVIDMLWALFQFYVIPNIAHRTGTRKGNPKDVLMAILKHGSHRVKNLNKAVLDGSAVVASIEQYRPDIVQKTDISQCETGESKSLALLSALEEEYGLPPMLSEGDLSGADVKGDSRGLMLVLSLIIDTVAPQRTGATTASGSPSGSLVGAPPPSPLDEAELAGLRLKVAGLERQLARVEAAAGKLQMMVSLMLSDQDAVGAARAAEMRAVERIAALEQNSEVLKSQLEQAMVALKATEAKLDAANELVYPELAEESMAFPDGMPMEDKLSHLQQLVVMYKTELRTVSERSLEYAKESEALRESNAQLTKDLHAVRQKKVELQKLLVNSKMKVGSSSTSTTISPRRSAPTRTGMATPLRARTGTDTAVKTRGLDPRRVAAHRATSAERSLKRSMSAATMPEHDLIQERDSRALKKSNTLMTGSVEEMATVAADELSTPKRKKSKRGSHRDEKGSSKRTRSDSSNSSPGDEKKKKKHKRERKAKSGAEDSDVDSLPSTPCRSLTASPERESAEPQDDDDDKIVSLDSTGALINELDEILDLVDGV
mmetsp:Transcript_15834/g.61873  ORF Transcript_15834/g.61873 Transcript_15834/m.61873 type:complete len:663 (-) Transcript_15834:46-2034(-)